MPTIPKILTRAAAATSSATLYTTPSATTTILTEVTVTNTSAGALTFTIALDTIELFSAVSIAANTTTTYSMKQVLTATKTITGLASATDVNFFLAGVEIS
jgi:hypothetical protein